MQSSVRLALVSSPRSGNTWLRGLLATIYQAEEVAAHNPADLDWPNLPRRCVLQIHWHRTESFVSLLRQERFQVVTLCRHPLDLLMSILHFAPHSLDTARWLEGQGGTEHAIHGVMPRSHTFLDYATGPRARALLNVSREWWNAPGAHCVRYEDLVQDTVGQLDRLTSSLEDKRLASPAQAASARSLENLREFWKNQHFWQGKPGLWKRLLIPKHARRIAAAHKELFQWYGYTCDADELLDAGQADANWLNLDIQRISSELINLKRFASKPNRLEHVDGELTALRTQIEEAQATVSELRAQLQLSTDALQDALAQVSELHAKMADVGDRVIPEEGLGPYSLGIARRVHRVSKRMPRVSAVVKRLISS